MKQMCHFGLVVVLGIFIGQAWAEDTVKKQCSQQGHIVCDPNAECKDLTETEFECVCITGYEGDGKMNGTGCTVERCEFDNQCAELATCNTTTGTCVCNDGYGGDATQECTDINECLLNLCHHNATCENTPGSFSCRCKSDQLYVGNGTHCAHQCTVDTHCHAETEECDVTAQICVCKKGFYDNSKNCQNIDECEEGTHDCPANSTCEDTFGGFICTCNNGFEEVNDECKILPINCEQVRVMKPKAKSGYYTIDPDGGGDLLPVEVYCELRKEIGITIVRNKAYRVWARKSVNDINMDYEQSLDVIKAIIESSGYCFQDMSLRCYNGFTFMDENSDWWTDGNFDKQYNWGGATLPNQCLCGEYDFCSNISSNCFCDGTTTSENDYGRLFTKEILPVLNVHVETTMGRSQIRIGNLQCAPKTFDLPLDCDDAKKTYKVKTSGYLVMDIDGPEGPLKPYIAYCDMLPHVGVTVIGLNGDNSFSENGNYEIRYKVSDEHIKKLVERSKFCSQDSRYDCKNSPNPTVTDIWGQEHEHGPGGMGEPGFCACGLLGVCEDASKLCNCDIQDGQNRTDRGKETNKGFLPFKNVSLNAIGSGSYGKYTVGPLKCSQEQFGIKPTCHYLVDDGDIEESVAHLIDPDGPPKNSEDTENQIPILAYCDVKENPKYGVTVIYHTERIEILLSGSLTISYLLANNKQLASLISRSTSCTQQVAYRCNSATIHGPNSLDFISLVNDVPTSIEKPSCACALNNTCQDDNECNCDKGDNTERLDSLLFNDKEELPITQVDPGSSGMGYLLLGPLECKELTPTCSDLIKHHNKHKLVDQEYIQDGVKVIEPLPGRPFSVVCTSTMTTVTTIIDNPDLPNNNDVNKGVSKCHDVTYSSPDGSGIDNEQIQALVSNSLYCYQTAGHDCLNAPATGMTNFSTCDGTLQQGWFGSNGEDMCQCGVVNNCDGGSPKCSCDVVDGETHSDMGTVVNKDRLAICQVCYELDPTSLITNPSIPKERSVKSTVSDLFCDKRVIGSGTSCQDWRRQGQTESGEEIIHLTTRGRYDFATVRCRYSVNPPYGFSEIKPKNETIDIPETGREENVTYFIQTFDFVPALIDESIYCKQELILNCTNAVFDIEADGWLSRDGEFQTWPEGIVDDDGCSRSGNITVSAQMPVTGISFGPSSGKREVTVGPVICFNLRRNCHEILQNKENKNPFGDNEYAIDVDGPGPLEPFKVICDFRTVKGYGITKVKLIPPTDTNVINSTDPGSYEIELEYEGATAEQIDGLTKTSKNCLQKIDLICKNTPIYGNDAANPRSFYETPYGRSNSWGTAGFTDVVGGCACSVLGTCGGDKNCNCDAEGVMTSDYGYETEHLPITRIRIGGQTNDGYGRYDVSDVMCSAGPLGLPTRCEDIYNDGNKISGSYLLQPTIDADITLVHCKMDMLPNTGVLVVNTNLIEKESVEYGTTTEVEYLGPTFEQLLEVVKKTKYCVQPVKYECLNTKMSGHYAMYGGLNLNNGRDYFGFGRPNTGGECTCGRDRNKCGGSEPTIELVNLHRGCSCDANDNVPRVDAGLFTTKEHLPINSFEFTSTSNSSGNITVGPLMCSQAPFDINECEIGFNDCHEKAICYNLDNTKNDVGFRCECIKGFQGIGRSEWANGRNCIDDNECAENLNSCPLNADCTNLEGSFDCKCREGFEPKGSAKKRCIDIDECARGMVDCGENAECRNTYGSYKCKCKTNYRFDGQNCTAMAKCSVYGDPHAVTFDGLRASYQGLCDYILARDKCDEETPSFQITAKFFKKYHTPYAASWIKSVVLTVSGEKIEILPGNEVRYNGLTITPTYVNSNFKITSSGNLVEVVSLREEIEIKYNINGALEIYVPGNFAGETCGICGNYNNNHTDDPTIGPACSGEGNVTENIAEFFESWVNPDNEEECSANCSAVVTEECSDEDKAIAEVQCLKLYGKNKVFKDCLVAMDELHVDNLHSSCIYDVCRVEDTEQAICDHGQILLSECSGLTEVVLEKSFRTADFCPLECGDTKDYHHCITGPERTCADYLNNQNASTSLNTACVEGCKCIDGYVLDGQDCVLPENCGCIIDGIYYKKDTIITKDNCLKSVTCLGNDMISSEESIQCHENATCKTLNGIYSCHCDDGYYGNGTSCVVDPCYPNNPCNEKETCVNNMEAENFYQCDCQPGYVADCGVCKNLNECETELNTCPKKSYCNNTDGSFECTCFPGYFLSGGECEDIDECAKAQVQNKNICGNNSVCVNKIGKYECKCCEGYAKNDNKECVPKAGAQSDEKCCVCIGGRCNNVGKVCGSNHETYDSYAAFEIAKCQNNLRGVTLNYYGKCKNTCPASNKPPLCPKYQECVPDANGKPVCECEECTVADMTSGEVCSSFFIIYPNRCTFKKIACKHDIEPEILVEMDHCLIHSGGLNLKPWSEWTPCSVSCGKGTTTRYREGHVSAIYADRFPLTAEADCYGPPCPNDTCVDKYEECKNQSAECVVNENGDAKCECPSCNDIPNDPVCGYLIKEGKEDKPETYKSACYLQKIACKQNLDHMVFTYGPCEVKPVDCALVPDTKVLFNDAMDYTSVVKKSLHACSGKCETDYCCKPNTEKREFVLHKIGNNTAPTKSFEFDVATSCSCEELFGPGG